MPWRTVTLCSAGLLFLAVVCHVAFGSDTDDKRTTTHAITVEDNGSSLPDFDGDGTIGFGDFVIFAGVFGARQGDEKYEAKYDLNGDGEIGFSDFVIFAQNFGKEAPSPVVAIPDPNLRTAIESALNKDSGAPITQAEMATLDSLEASDADISDLAGLEYATNLTWLDLASNDITSVSVLEGLTNLAHLILSGNNVTDLAGLVANTGLGTGDTVDLADNPLNAASQSTHIPALQARGVRVSFVPPAVAIPDANLRAVIETALDKDSNAPITEAEMATLDSLAASDAEITDLTGMNYAANLTYLSLNDNDITDISALAKLTSLTRLWLSNNSIEDISALSKLTNLTELWLWNNQIEDISPLSGLTNLTRLSLGRNNVTDVSALAGLTNLTVLILKSNQISDLSPLVANKGLGAGGTVDVTDNPLNPASHSTHVPALQARGVRVSFVPSPAVAIPDANLRAAIAAALGKATGAPITQADMATLTRLSASSAGIRNLIGLESAANLTRLFLSSNSITDISPLAGLTNVSALDLWDNQLADISVLSGLTRLTWLGLGLNNITDISPLSGLTNLDRLSIGQNNITDISPLARLTNLKSLSVGDANISDLSVVAGLTNLRDLSLLAAHVQDEDLSLLSGLSNLTSLGLSHNRISDISPLAELTGLTRLWLWDNLIEDISALSGLTGMTFLSLGKNNVSDISALAHLINLTELYLNDNKITDVSPLEGLTNLTFLDLALNNVEDISALSGLSKLMELNLAGNRITDTSALSGLTNLRNLDLRGNPHETLPRGDFEIEFVFLDNFTESQKQVLQYVARRWMAVIRDDLPDYVFSGGWSGQCGKQPYEIPAGERIDDLRIYINTFQGGSALGYGGPSLLREESHLPVVGCMAFDLSHANLLITGLHEIGHVLGFASEVWNEFNFYQNPQNGDTHFNGPLATAAFDNAGGRDYKNAKVPLQKDESHWRGGVFGDELMTPTGTGALSAITVQSLADLGYGVDVTQADAYTLPGATAGAKIALSLPPASRTGVDSARDGISPPQGADLYGQGRTSDGPSSILGDGRTGRQESAERVWGHGVNVNLWENRQTWGTGSPAHVEPELTCGAGLMNEPIYVIDPQGRIVRTIHR